MKTEKSPNIQQDEYAIVMGIVLKEERKRKGLGIVEVAEELGITPSYISQIENGKKNPTLHVMENYAKLLGMDLFELSLRVKMTGCPNRNSLKGLVKEISKAVDLLSDLRE